MICIFHIFFVGYFACGISYQVSRTLLFTVSSWVRCRVPGERILTTFMCHPHLKPYQASTEARCVVRGIYFFVVEHKIYSMARLRGQAGADAESKHARTRCEWTSSPGFGLPSLSTVGCVPQPIKIAARHNGALSGCAHSFSQYRVLGDV